MSNKYEYVYEIWVQSHSHDSVSCSFSLLHAIGFPAWHAMVNFEGRIRIRGLCLILNICTENDKTSHDSSHMILHDERNNDVAVFWTAYNWSYASRIESDIIDLYAEFLVTWHVTKLMEEGTSEQQSESVWMMHRGDGNHPLPNKVKDKDKPQFCADTKLRVPWTTHHRSSSCPGLSLPSWCVRSICGRASLPARSMDGEENPWRRGKTKELTTKHNSRSEAWDFCMKIW